ncbi:SIR2 family NAD-dependent protein deacylase [Serratia silvae]|uniref:SIR2 family protein n=1 Tax=Serratia silvae TaxID=2824122 RepID=A0ABT0KE28_9GAMM|nr:SIR2 family protein [Serratia silvae]MCL1030196.1 SIR2 family protein [Serratia silvae]
MQNHVEPFLADILDKLWSNHAAVLVGAGFSKNAKPNSANCLTFPSWEELGDVFYRKIHCNDNNGKYLNVLKLADEVEAAFGRGSLEQILINNIPDKDYEPSDLHVKLLNLPWVDVFTTNYDTLLERACTSVISHKYDVVLTKADLINAERPRIIKLHGSFPSERPFIITEEDYRKYPFDFSPFVNTVQQSLIENTLCLIGFSGDDPNFLKWIGWIRDNLGAHNSPKIYLIGVFNLSNAQSKLLEKRNVTVIDLGGCDGVNHNHYLGMEFFIKSMMKGKMKRDNLSWPSSETVERYSIRDDSSISISKISKLDNVWRGSRLRYPGWCILPEENRNTLWSFTNGWVNFLASPIEIEDELEFSIIFEVLWRLDKALCPLIDGLSLRVENIINRNWGLLSGEMKFITGNRIGTFNEAREKLIFLCNMLLRFYRQEDNRVGWERLSQDITVHYELLSPEEKALYNYERSLFSLFKLDIKSVNYCLSNWERNEALPFYEAKRAGILAELGKVDEAISIVEKSLNTIRKRLSLKPITINYADVSQEAYVMLLVQYFKSSSLRDKPIEDTEVNINEFSERWGQLAQYRSDPWNELKTFRIRLERDDEYSKKEYGDFDLGVRKRSRSFDVYHTELISSVNFLLFCEAAGIPFKIPHARIASESAVGALKRIYAFCPYWSMASMFRLGDKKYVESILNRVTINSMDRKEIDKIIESNLEVFYSIFDIHSERIDSLDGLPSGLISVIPEIVSRLVAKCSLEVKFKVIELLEKIYRIENKPKFLGISNLTKRVLSSLSVKDKISVIPVLLNFPIVTSSSPYISREYQNPLVVILDLNNINLSRNYLKINKEIIDKNIKMVSSSSTEEREWASTTLIFLNENGLLTRGEEKRLTKALWSDVCEFGFPKNISYYKFIFLNKLAPDSVNVRSLFVKYISTYSFPIQSLLKEKGVMITNGDDNFCTEIIGGLRFIELDENDIAALISKLDFWFESDMRYLSEQQERMQGEFFARFNNITRILIALCEGSFKNITDKNINNICDLVRKMKEHGCMTLELECVLLYGDTAERSKIANDIDENLSSINKSKVLSALKAVHHLIKNYDIKEMLPIIESMAGKIKWRSEIYLYFTVDIVKIMYDENPEGLPQNFHEVVFSFLNTLADESYKNTISDDNAFLEYLELRVHIASLASSMYEYFSSKDIPSILRWKEICSSNDEFDEVKNAWNSMIV